MRKDPSGWTTRVREEDIARYARAGVWRNVTLADCARHQVRHSPHRVTVVDGTQARTFGEIFAEAQRLSRAFAALGLRQGDVVSLQLPNWSETMALNLAASMAGVVINPIVPIYRESEVGYILRDARTRLFLVPQTFRGFDYPAMAQRLRGALPDLDHVVVLRGQASGCLSYADLLARGDAAGLASPAPDPNAVKLVLYTSGTTGQPKGVLHSHNTIMSEIDAVIRYWEIDERDVILMPSPVTHITGYLYALELAFAAGIRVVFMERWSAAEAVDLIGRHAVSFSVGATPFLKELVAEVEARKSGLPSLRRFMTGGAPVPPEVVQRAAQVLPDCLTFRVYGSTEAPTITLGIRDRSEAQLGAVTDGRIVNHEVRIADPATGALLPEGADGEICARGPEVMLGYTDQRQTEEAFDADGYFRTGDLGYRSHGEFLTVSGRRKDLIIRGGENLSPKEIEDALHRHPAIREVACVAMPHERLGETVCAFVIPQPGCSMDVPTLAAHLEHAGLARQKFPERVELVDDLPRTASGKVQKNVLRERIAQALERESKMTGAGSRPVPAPDDGDSRVSST